MHVERDCQEVDHVRRDCAGKLKFELALTQIRDGIDDLPYLSFTFAYFSNQEGMIPYTPRNSSQRSINPMSSFILG